MESGSVFTDGGEVIDKQKMLLSADVGHFSLVRAMHLADFITLMNGMHLPPQSSSNGRYLTDDN